ncbi:MAG: hypothetical protein ABI151_15925, partial [Chitinophagaceae bacterium]
MTISSLNYNPVLARKIILAIFCALMFVHLGFVFAGFYKGDDINFSRYAAAFAHQGFSYQIPTDHFQLRWTPIFFTAIFYKLWGINAFTSGLFSTICIALCGFILHKIIRRQPISVYLLTMALFFFSRAMVFYGHRLLADGPVCLAVLSMYYFYRSALGCKPANASDGSALLKVVSLSA